MAIYLCRWPNGEFSIVNGKTKDDAVVLLDEWGNAEQASLTRLTDCMFDFRLADDGRIELQNIGESTEARIMEACWHPKLSDAFATAEMDETEQDFSEKGSATRFSARRLSWKERDCGTASSKGKMLKPN